MFAVNVCLRNVQDLPVTIRATASNVEFVDDRREQHAVRRHMFIPTSQFHLYGHVKSLKNSGGGANADNDDEDDENNDAVGTEDDAPQLTVSCTAARAVRFYLVNIYLILVFFRHLSSCSRNSLPVPVFGRAT